MAEQARQAMAKSKKRCRVGCWVLRVAVGAGALLVLVVVAGAVYQATGTARDRKRYPPPGRMVAVGGHRLHISIIGDGGPTVVLDAGVCDCSLNWCLVQPEVAKFARVCSYDRAGMGWSETGPHPRTSERIVQELHTLLEEANVPGPYVLVGHSFGGYNVRLFAHEYPNEVAGLVLVDAAHEDQWPGLPESVKGLYDWWTNDMRSGRLRSRLGLLRLLDWVPVNPKLPPALQPMDRAVHARTSFLETLYSEWTAIDSESAAQVRAGRTLPQVPMVVLTAEKHGDEPPPGVTDEDFAQWNELLYEMQADLARRCEGSLHVRVPESTHVIQLDQPGVVVNAIREVVMAVREQRPLQADAIARR